MLRAGTDSGTDSSKLFFYENLKNINIKVSDPTPEIEV